MLQFVQCWLHNKFLGLLSISVQYLVNFFSINNTERHFQYIFYIIFFCYFLLQCYVPNKAYNDEWFSITFWAVFTLLFKTHFEWVRREQFCFLYKSCSQKVYFDSSCRAKLYGWLSFFSNSMFPLIPDKVQ